VTSEIKGFPLTHKQKAAHLRCGYKNKWRQGIFADFFPINTNVWHCLKMNVKLRVVRLSNQAYSLQLWLLEHWPGFLLATVTRRCKRRRRQWKVTVMKAWMLLTHVSFRHLLNN